MTALKELSVTQLGQALKIRKRINAFQQETKSLQLKLDKILGSASPAQPVRRRKKRVIKKAVRKKVVPKKTVKVKKAPKKTANLRNVITDVLKRAKKPLNLDEIVAGIRRKGVKMRSKNPKHSLGVKMYRDKAFKKARPGYFTLRVKKATKKTTRGKK